MILEDIRDLLVSKGVTAAIRGGVMPTTPDTLIALYDTSGFEPVRVMGRVALEVRNLQVLTRDPNAAAAETLANQVFTALDMYVGMINGKNYSVILGRQVPFPIGKDENNRTQYSCNYIVRKER